MITWAIQAIEHLIGLDPVKVAGFFLIFNTLLTALQKGLSLLSDVLISLKDKINPDLDGKLLSIVAIISGYVGQGLAILAKIIDIISANSAH